MEEVDKYILTQKQQLFFNLQKYNAVIKRSKHCVNFPSLIINVKILLTRLKYVKEESFIIHL
jgi:hypothetical protein